VTIDGHGRLLCCVGGGGQAPDAQKIPLLNGKGGPPFLFTYNSKVVAAQLTTTKF